MKKYVVWAGMALGLLASAPGAFADNGPKLMTPQYTYNAKTIIAGAKLFATDCMACHSIKFMRYEFLTQDLGMSKADVHKYIMLPTGSGFKGNMVSAMPTNMAHKWFGLPPPDLSQMVRYKSQDWVYTYLLSFYQDPKRPSGWNNHVFPNVAMPDVLAPSGGIVNEQGKVLRAGDESPQKFKEQVTDIVAFLRFVSDPSVVQRHDEGPWVLGLLALFTIFAYFLKKEYWKDVK
ncbi:cytochrome c1 [Acidithiobacillus sp.]|jgi:ubiquinol-cytochrome c reductase cytochrome c1 subunit